MVRDRRFELPRPKIGHKILSLARLPIPPIPHGLLNYNTIYFWSCQTFRGGFLLGFNLRNNSAKSLFMI